MKFWFSLLFLLWGSLAIAQTTVYQAFEVDSAAVPRGGMAFINAFIQANLRKPVAAEAKGIGGRTIVKGIVETDGRITEVKLLNTLRPDCDREALRVFNLFNAWKPAYKDGKSVRQEVNIPVIFKPNTPFIYENGARISYFDADSKPLVDSSQARYKQLAPVDSIGIPTGDLVLYKGKGSSWKEEVRWPLIRKSNEIRGASGKTGYLIGYQDGIIQWDGQLVSVDDQGSLLQQVYFQNGKRVGTSLTYHPNGSVAEQTEEFDVNSIITSWYANGQVKQIRTVNKPKPRETYKPEQTMAYWDNVGHQLITAGTGRVIYENKTESYSDSTRHTLFIEQGAYQDGYKQGIWTGRYADGSYFYEEQYEKGINQRGKARVAGADTVRYTEVEKQPEFIGGMQGLGKFLSQTLRYPANAQRDRVQGRVSISFVVCTDGTLCDYEVLKGVQPDLDQEALRVVKQMSGRWTPGVQRGQKVRVKYRLPINFTLQ